MGTATQLTTFSDLYTDLQNRVRVQTGVTSTEAQSKRYINIALHDMHVGFGEQFPWAERRANLVTQPDYNTGTVTISQGSASLAGTSTAWNTNNAFGVDNMRVGGKLTIGGSAEVYEVSAVGSDTAATLDTIFIDADVSAGSYQYFEDEYALDAAFLRPIDLNYFDQNRSIPLISRTEFRQRYPRNKTPGKTVVATIIDLAFSGSTTPVRKLLLHPPPADAQVIPYWFVTRNLAVTAAGAEQAQLVNDTDEPIVPLQYRHVLVFHALYHWYRDKKNDQRRAEAKSEYTDLILRIAGDQEIGGKRPQIQPRIGSYTRAARRPYRGGRYTVGSSFDELR